MPVGGGQEVGCGGHWQVPEEVMPGDSTAFCGGPVEVCQPFRAEAGVSARLRVRPLLDDGERAQSRCDGGHDVLRGGFRGLQDAPCLGQVLLGDASARDEGGGGGHKEHEGPGGEVAPVPGMPQHGLQLLELHVRGMEGRDFNRGWSHRLDRIGLDGSNAILQVPGECEGILVHIGIGGGDGGRGDKEVHLLGRVVGFQVDGGGGHGAVCGGGGESNALHLDRSPQARLCLSFGADRIAGDGGAASSPNLSRISLDFL